MNKENEELLKRFLIRQEREERNRTLLMEIKADGQRYAFYYLLFLILGLLTFILITSIL